MIFDKLFWIKTAVAVLIAVSLFGKGWLMGNEHANEKWQAKHNQAVEAMLEEQKKSVEEANRKADADRKAATLAEQERDKARDQAKEANKRLSELIAKPVYVECKADKSVVDELNKALRGNK